MDPKKLIEDSGKFLMDTYNRYPMVMRKGRGMKLWSSDGHEYLDFIGGIATNVLGHCHRKVVIAVQKQAQRLMHVSNFFHIEPQIELARLLVGYSFADRAFFCNSGTEACEAAIKLARKYCRENISPERFEIITAFNSFHGRTYGALSATGQIKFHKGFEPMLPGFKYVPFNDVSSLEKAISETTCAIMLEPIQGEAGVRIPDPSYLKDIRVLCDEKGLLLILDEIQTGIGRTGKLFAYEHYGVLPDIMTLAKGLGGGVPIGALLATEKVASAFGRGSHGSTFGGNPLACAAAVATVQTVLEDGILLDQCVRMGEYLLKGLNMLMEEFPGVIVDVRGMGLLCAMELTRDCTSIAAQCADMGVLVNCTAGNVLRFMPPLIVEKEEIDRLMDVLSQALERHP